MDTNNCLSFWDWSNMELPRFEQDEEQAHNASSSYLTSTPADLYMHTEAAPLNDEATRERLVPERTAAFVPAVWTLPPPQFDISDEDCDPVLVDVDHVLYVLDQEVAAGSKRKRSEECEVLEEGGITTPPPRKVHAAPLSRGPRDSPECFNEATQLVTAIEQPAASVSVTDDMVIWFPDRVTETTAAAFPQRMTNKNEYGPLDPPLPMATQTTLVNRELSCAVQYQREGHNDGFWVGPHDWLNNLYTIVMQLALYLVVRPGTDIRLEVVKMLPTHYFDSGHRLEIFADKECSIPLSGPLSLCPVDEVTAALHLEDLSDNTRFTREFVNHPGRQVGVVFAKATYVQPKDLDDKQKLLYRAHKEERAERAKRRMGSALAGAPIFGLRATATCGNSTDCFWQPIGPLRARPAKNKPSSSPQLLKPTSPPKEA